MSSTCRAIYLDSKGSKYTYRSKPMKYLPCKQTQNFIQKSWNIIQFLPESLFSLFNNSNNDTTGNVPKFGNNPKVSFLLTPSLRRPCIHAIFFRPPVGQRVNTHSVFWEFFRKPCQHATRGCDKCWMTCIHAGVLRSPREHASVPPDKRHCRQWMSSLFCGFLPNPFIYDLFCWSSRHKFVKTDL